MNGDRLATARARASDAEALEKRLTTVRRQILDRQFLNADLEEQVEAEAKDVEALEGLGLASLFATLRGTKEEQLAKEKAEELAALLKLKAGREALLALEDDERGLRERLDALGDAKAELRAARAERESEIVASGAAGARRLADIDALLADARAVAKEVGEAEEAATSALGALAAVDDSLRSAHNWGTWDLVGGGMLATWAKHTRIDEARSAASRAQAALSRLAREAADVRGMSVGGELVVEVDGFSRFADFFFDGLLADWMVQSKIQQSQANVAGARSGVERLRERLRQKRRELASEIERLERERGDVVDGA